MKKNAMRKNLTQSIAKSFGRYIAIVAIIALGASMFVGLLMTKTDMVATGQKYMDEQNMFDLRLMNLYGWTQEDLDAISQLDGVVDVEGILYTDLIVRLNDGTEDLVYRFYAMPEKINMFSLRGGRLPQSPDECLADGYHMDDSILGTTITVSETNSEDALDSVTYRTYTVVGYVASPLYMDMNRGTTTVGGGSLTNYIYVFPECLNLEYYPEIHVTLPGDYAIYSDAYNNAMEYAADRLRPVLQPYADKRLADVKTEAKNAYRDGVREYEEGLQEFLDAKQETEQELEEAYQKLLDAEQQIADNEALLRDGQQQIQQAKFQLYDAELQLQEGREQYEQMKKMLLDPIVSAETPIRTRYEELMSQKAELDAQIAAIDEQIADIYSSMGEDSQRVQVLEAEIGDLTSQIASLNGQIRGAQALRDTLALFPTLNAEAIARLDETITQLTQQRDQLAQRLSEAQGEYDRLSQELSGPMDQIRELNEQKEPLISERDSLDRRIQAILPTLEGFISARQEVETMLADAEAEIIAGEQQIAEAWAMIYSQEQQIRDGLAALEEAKLDLEQGWKDYEEGKEEAEREFARAEQELADAKEQLDNARDMIVKMRSNEVIILDRSSNIGYNSLSSSSDIVQGVSRVFPAFFLLVAALVCITTMTRMIDEERTQIGTLKAMGYSNGAIISKYLIYAGSGAVLGCGLGVLVGSAAFPMILWEAYKIMLYITDGIVLKINWWLCGAVVGAYTSVMLLVTWYCCRKALQEVPAELIRPKAPDPGKKILLERLPVWEKLGFLNKVMIRNIFRYRQRLAMMIVGIGGCTALLVTGFGLRDSIVNVVDYQFEEVTTYDMSVYFSGNQTEDDQKKFLEKTADGADKVMFYHQSSVDLEFDHSVKGVYLIAAESGITEFIDLHSGKEALEMPGINEVVLSVGVAEAMNIHVGDTIRLRNADMDVLEVTVSGIYDNHVENYAIVLPATIAQQWEEPPAMQMAFVTVKDGIDAYEFSAEIGGYAGVMSVSVSEDLADMVGNMMDALDLVVIVVVLCAAALAVIVLYNLTNININERIREIATIKVLGFNAKETGAYVFKENLSLSAIGSVIGLGLGYLLLLFVMSQVRIDMVWFKAMVMPQSYVWAITLTMLSACVVDFIFYFKLDKINMAEALKSVE